MKDLLQLLCTVLQALNNENIGNPVGCLPEVFFSYPLPESSLLRNNALAAMIVNAKAHPKQDVKIQADLDFKAVIFSN